MNVTLYPKLASHHAGIDHLLSAIDFQQRSVRVYGKVHLQPRLTCWYGPVPYTYSGLTWDAAPMPTLIETLRASIEQYAGVQLNSVLCNLYRDGADSVGWHSDDEAIFGADPVVASLSFGATRAFKVRAKADHAKVHAFDLAHGSLLVMGRGVQAHYEHCVPRTRRATGPRVNLTFRQV